MTEIEADRIAAETRKFVEESHKLAAEREKLFSEALKLERERWWYFPVAILSSNAIAAIIGVLAAKLIH